jgi:N utilization substance protein B
VSARSKARKHALDILFEAEQRAVDPVTLLHRDPEPRAYTRDLVEGVTRHRTDIDRLLDTYSQGWRLDRMPAVDRNVLRLGAYELLYCADVPDAVAIDEAVQLAKDLSTDESPAFVNGLLGRLVEVTRSPP